MCDDCRARWFAALDARQPRPGIVLVQCGRYDGAFVGREQLRRADEHAARVRAWQDQIKRTCEAEHMSTP